MSVINYVTQIQFGHGVLETLKGECNRLGIKAPLVVTDVGVRAAGIVDKVLAQLGTNSGAGVYDQTPPNPNEQAVRDASEQFRTGKHDGIIAVGGGSSIDLAKGVAVCARHDGPLRSFALIEGGIENITAATAPVIAIPTTAGTGSEVGRGAILILDDGRKVGIISPHVVPKVAICDPDLTVGLPPMLTAATGMDAIAHCIETFLSPLFNPPADGIALDGLRRAWSHIELAVNQPDNKTARLNMMSASMQGALAFQKGLGCVHSLSHSLGGINPRLHHGTLNAIFLPAVVEFNRSAPTVIDEQKLERLAQAMGIAGADAVVPALTAMSQRLGLPTGLAELDVSNDLFPRIIQGALADHSHKTNPKNASVEDYTAMLKASM
ncbi:iron-containing alcohol dehydrogenase [Pollutimonas harenae]|uniref:Iron-containing alcohol dehydrogenase n=1 Tax=Pollutimonas harenae TaxID=657015 RepID=A0A853GRK0_9BURK|nr:iron-containing alcohol dehydrogenase [Pollutimonas harenae]NYT84801.1 iron-containing alcohol dehydrogenase [Pollutimonas harenae]TEA72800.1 iron-containing alcohol dehydrogenase [Pollutimonas harenae]